MPADRADPLSVSLEATLHRYGTMVQRVGARHGLTGADADELLQEVRIRLWKAGSTSERIEGLGTSYVYRTALSAAVDLLRGRRRGVNARIDATAPWHDDVAAGERHGPVEHLETLELGLLVDRAVDEIHVTRRAVVRMHLAGYEREEIAQLMGWSEAKTRNLLYRGLGDLRTRLTAQGIGPGSAA
jgi:RNA polymerase sigma-70 factor (ECF subfamily)